MRIITRGVSFNLDDPDQDALHTHARTRANFSGYIKRLIQRDMEFAKKTPASSTVSGSRVTLVITPQSVKDTPGSRQNGCDEATD